MMKIIFSLILCLFFSGAVLGQDAIQYSYDKAGNRIKRREVIFGGGHMRKKGPEEQLPIEEKVGEYAVTIYPNPVKEQLNLKIKGEDLPANYTVTIVDYAGKEVYRKNYRDLSKQINVSDLSKGVYIVRIQIADYFSELKLIKQ